MGDRAHNNSNTKAVVTTTANPVANPAVTPAGGADGVAEVKSFDEMPLSHGLLRGVYSTGFERPSAIQQQAIVPMTRGGDVLAQAPSGTGKTGAFSIALRTVVLDEADEMLSQGFAEQVTRLFSFLPRDVQVGLFSATMPPEVVELTQRFMRAPTRILLPPEQLTLKGIRQFFVALSEEDKIAALEDLYETVSVAQSVVFANRRDKVTWVEQQLAAHHHTVAALHAEVPRAERARVMGEFRSGSARVLVTSDLVARGIDVQHVNIVINYDLSEDIECYLHRIGRSGRFGRKGLAINFVTPRDVPLLRRIEQHYGVAIEELPQDFALCLADD